MCESKDLELIDPYFNSKQASTVALPLRIGTIAHVEGLEKVKKMPEVVDVTVYYGEGHECVQMHINTLDQLFARVMVVSETKEKMFDTLMQIRNLVSVKDIDGQEMIIWDTFDKIYNEQYT